MQFAPADTQAKNCKRVCLANAHSELKETSENQAEREKHYAQQRITTIAALCPADTTAQA